MALAGVFEHPASYQRNSSDLNREAVYERLANDGYSIEKLLEDLNEFPELADDPNMGCNPYWMLAQVQEEE